MPSICWPVVLRWLHARNANRRQGLSHQSAKESNDIVTNDFEGCHGWDVPRVVSTAEAKDAASTFFALFQAGVQQGGVRLQTHRMDCWVAWLLSSSYCDRVLPGHRVQSSLHGGRAHDTWSWTDRNELLQAISDCSIHRSLVRVHCRAWAQASGGQSEVSGLRQTPLGD